MLYYTNKKEIVSNNNNNNNTNNNNNNNNNSLMKIKAGFYTKKINNYHEATATWKKTEI